MATDLAARASWRHVVIDGSLGKPDAKLIQKNLLRSFGLAFSAAAPDHVLIRPAAGAPARA